MAKYVLDNRGVGVLRRLVAGTLKTSGGQTNASGAISHDNFAAPFTVRWSASEANGSWVVWLPDAAKLVAVDEAFVSISGASAAQNLPSGWYTVSGVAAGAESVYLSVKIPKAASSGGTEPAGTPSAKLSGNAESAAEGYTVVNMLVATMATDSESGAKRVKQFLASAVALTSKGDPAPDVPPVDDVSIELYSEPPPETPETPGSGEGEEPEEPEEKYSVKGWHDQPAEATELVDLLAGDGSPTPYEVLVRDATPEAGSPVKYVPLGKGLMKQRMESVELTTVSAVEYGEYDVDGETDWRIRITSRTVTFATDGTITVGNPTYSYINTVAHTSEMDGGGSTSGGAS